MPRAALARDPFSRLARLVPADALPTSGRDDILGGHRPILHMLLRDLGRACAMRYAALWLPAYPSPDTNGPVTGTPWRPAVVWRSRRWGRGLTLPDPADDPDRLLALAGVVATVDVTDGGNRCGVLVLAHRAAAAPGAAPVALLGEAALGVGLLLRHARHRSAGAAARERAVRAARQLDVTRLELATIQAVERDRLAVAVTATPNRQLRAILAAANALERAVHGGAAEAGSIAAGIRTDLHGMIEEFRTVVRGVYPQVLRGAGVCAALEEMTAALPVAVKLSGDLGRRVGWEIESSLYQAAASAVAALAARGGDEPMRIELSRTGEVLAIRVRRDRAEPASVMATLGEDARRLAALGGRLSVDRTTPPAGAVVEIAMPERLGVDLPELVGPARTRPGERPAKGAAGPPARSGPTNGAAAAENLSAETAATAAGRLLLSSWRDPGPVGTPVRVALDRQDGQVRVAVVGIAAEQLIPTLCGDPDWPGWLPPEAARGPVTDYEPGPSRRLTLDPGRAAPWPPVRISDWSAVSWPETAPGLHRTVVEAPGAGLGGLRLRHLRDRVDPDLALRLRRWSAGEDGPPDAVLLVLGGPASAAESEFLTVLRSPDGEGYPAVAICAMRDGAVVTSGSRRWLQSMSDAVVGWQPATGGAAAVTDELRTRLVTWSEALATRWALRALRAARDAGQLEAPVAAEVDAFAAAADQVAELDLRQALQARRITLAYGQPEALRLLGTYGVDARSRLGLAGDAASEQVVRAAERVVAYWRAQALAPEAVPPGRDACAVLVRAGERLRASST